MIQDQALAQEWIAVNYSDAVKDEPVQVTVLGERVVLFKTSSGVKALKDMCIHRGTTLSAGTIKDDCIVCPYHGWNYNGEGQCTKIPQLKKSQSIPAKAKATTYACMEKYGLIWVNLGNNLPEEPSFPILDDESYNNKLLLGPFDVFGTYPRYIESGLDTAHFAFVHAGSLGDPNNTLIPDYKVTQNGKNLITSEMIFYQPQQASGSGVTSHYVFEVFGANTLTVRILNKEADARTFILATVLPVSERHTIVFLIFAFTFEVDNEEVTVFQTKLFNEDKYIVERQFPEDLPLDLHEELHLKPDRLSMAYRKVLAEMGVVMGTA
jgi:phenylpropionate dioxygenase-like ring-hydroxylating dioxygenase large terminal subunit